MSSLTSLPRVVILLLLSIHSFGQQFPRTVFDLGDRNDGACEIFNECDCCVARLYFIDEKQFAVMDYCMPENVLFSGTYEVSSSQLILTFRKVSVISGVDPITEKTYIKENEAVVKPITFYLKKCQNGALMLENLQPDSYRYGLKPSNLSAADEINSLLTSEEWKLLSNIK